MKYLIKIKFAFYLYFLLTIILILSPLTNLTADSENFRVKWTGEFKGTKLWQNDSGLGKKLFDFIFGNNNINLIRPVNVYVSDQNYWVLDQGSKALNFIDLKNKKMELIYNESQNLFPSLVGICGDRNGNIFFTDSKQNQIFVKQTNSDQLKIFNSELDLKQPTGIAYSKVSKTIWVSETAEHCLRVYNLKGEEINTIGNRGTKPGEFNYPTFIWIDDSGFVYIVDSMNFRVQILNNQGDIISIFGRNGDGSGDLARPKGIATDSQGNIYIVDALFHTVQIFDKQGNFLDNFGNHGTGDGEFWIPMGIYIDENDYIYVADSYNSRIQIFHLRKKIKDED